LAVPGSGNKKMLKETKEKTKNEAHGFEYESIDEKEFLMRTRSYQYTMGASFLTALTNLIFKFMKDAIFCA
jgi:hypothetical protein